MFAAVKLVNGEVMEDINGAWLGDIWLVCFDVSSEIETAGWLSFLKKSEDV